MEADPELERMVGILRGLLMAVVARHGAIEWVSVPLQHSMTHEFDFTLTRFRGGQQDTWRIEVHPRIKEQT